MFLGVHLFSGVEYIHRSGFSVACVYVSQPLTATVLVLVLRSTLNPWAFFCHDKIIFMRTKSHGKTNENILAFA